MPELPEVETYKNYFDQTSLNQEIKDIIIKDNRILNVDELILKDKVLNNSFISTTRHGKYLFVQMKDAYLIFHFGMTGDLEYVEDIKYAPKFTKVIFSFNNNHALCYISIRMFGWIDIADNMEDFTKKKMKLGPDAYKMTFDEFIIALKRRSANLKSLLLNQEVIAGVGNIYSDEILFQSRLDPNRTIDTLNEKELKLLFDCIKTVFEYGIKMKGELDTYSGKYLIPHRKKNGTCPNCDSLLRLIEVTGRRGYYCPKCQK